ncbi:uncharacterized protein, MTH1187 family [Evansella caseinilytica]|uniref:Uncharacterized protein, MTH1187 family n=1 Tax=Evansella caseinilytica TaxID=1503961 RepID=A0A1H3KR49_9BACI|nr:MTH1187 family thiamine-binding protein [Evansella caseinilytica]SDY54642.1 uncharacterized protein, MTH1187 family [Evansella caseinilytica]
MVKGMSFNKGIMFLGKKYIACTYENKGTIKTWIKPVNTGSMLKAVKLVIFSMPLWFQLFFAGWLGAILVPKMLMNAGVLAWGGLPPFTIIYFFFGTHFWFPGEMRKYHGAEHKVFSYKGIISISNQQGIKRAEITNRYCSTNGIFVYFLLLLLLWALVSFATPFTWLDSLETATYTAAVVWPAAVYWLHRTKTTALHRLILACSYWLQRHVTTAEPEDHHLRVAIRSYRRLAWKEFPQRLQIPKRKETKHMAIADITVIPIGTSTTSVSEVVAEIHLLLSNAKNIRYELTPMSTLMEGELEDLLKVIKEIHEIPFNMGVKRVATNIRIDDRRDRQSSMNSKLESVQRRLAVAADDVVET